MQTKYLKYHFPKVVIPNTYIYNATYSFVCFARIFSFLSKFSISSALCSLVLSVTCLVFPHFLSLFFLSLYLCLHTYLYRFLSPLTLYLYTSFFFHLSLFPLCIFLPLFLKFIDKADFYVLFFQGLLYLFQTIC